jgi:hypothetical protein
MALWSVKGGGGRVFLSPLSSRRRIVEHNVVRTWAFSCLTPKQCLKTPLNKPETNAWFPCHPIHVTKEFHNAQGLPIRFPGLIFTLPQLILRYCFHGTVPPDMIFNFCFYKIKSVLSRGQLMGFFYAIVLEWPKKLFQCCFCENTKEYFWFYWKWFRKASINMKGLPKVAVDSLKRVVFRAAFENQCFHGYINDFQKHFFDNTKINKLALCLVTVMLRCSFQQSAMLSVTLTLIFRSLSIPIS